MRQSWLLSAAAFYSASVFLSSARAQLAETPAMPQPASQVEVTVENQSPDVTTLQGLFRNKFFQRVGGALGAVAGTVQKVIVEDGTRLLKKVQEKGNKEFNRYNLHYSFDIDRNRIPKATSKVKLDASYQVSIKPSFLDGEQLRQDIYTFGLGTDNLKLAGNISIRFTFSRIFKGPSAKWDALTNFEFPFTAFWTKVPMNADGYKAMKDGEMVRVELLGKIGPEFKKEEIKNFRLIGGTIEAYKEALFAFDAQKVDRELFEDKKPRARLRFLALKNAGAGKVSANAGTKELAKHAPDFIRRIFSIGGSFSFLKSIGWNEPLPVDSLMVDYLFNFENEQIAPVSPTSAESAMNEIYHNILHFGFLDLIDPTIPTEDVSKRLLSYASKAEKFALEDVDNKLGEKARVRHLFKGRLRSNVQKTEVSGELTKFNKKNYQQGVMNSHVTSVDVRGNRSFYILENSFSRDYARSGFANRNQFERLVDHDFLIASDEKENVGPLMDIVTRTEIKQKSIDPQVLQNVAAGILDTMPKSFADANRSKIMSFYPTERQTNAHLTYQFNYGAAALKAIGAKLSNGDITLRTWDYILKNPRRKDMYLPFDNARGEQDIVAYHEVIDPIAKQVNIALAAATTNEDRLAAVRTLKSNPLFNDFLISEFFPSLVPDEGAADNMGLMMKFKSLQHQETDKATRIAPLKIGAANTSLVYDTVIFLRSIINGFDTFDMRLEQSKDNVVVIQQLRNFAPAEEDTNEPEDEVDADQD